MPLTSFQNFSFRLAYCAILVTIALPAPAKSDEPFPAPDCAERRLESNERCSPFEALYCAIAWACAEINGNSQGIAYTSCIGRYADARAEDKQGQQNLDQSLLDGGYVPEDFWQQYGVQPLHLARCATAIRDALSLHGFWESLASGDRVSEEFEQACRNGNLYPDATAELNKRTLQQSREEDER